MLTARKATGQWIKTGVWFVSAAIIAFCCSAQAESGAPDKNDQPNIRELSGRFPEKPSIAPSWSIPVEPLGFSEPGRNYLGMRNTMVSLDFLGENRLLFTFRVPGLMSREPGNSNQEQRQIRAVVLTLPSGAIQSETNWTLHDRSRYLWVVDDDHFLLRDRDTIFQNDAALNRKPLLQFPGPLASMQLNPGRQYIVTNSYEPAESAARTNQSSATSRGARASASSNDDDSKPELILRILRRDSQDVLLVTHIRNPVDIPLNKDGFLTAQRGNGVEWNVDLNYFSGPNRTLSTVKSLCAPYLDFISEEEALATACSDSGDNALVALTTAGKTLWIDLVSDRLVWPLIATARNGLRFARETLYVTHSINAFAPMGTDDIKGQWVKVFDSATGNVAFESQATPILDAGGNVALSPSGRRVAVLNAGAIQVFELPPPPALPAAATAPPAH